MQLFLRLTFNAEKALEKFTQSRDKFYDRRKRNQGTGHTNPLVLSSWE